MPRRKTPKNTEPVDDPLFGCDAVDVAICEAIEANTGATDVEIGRAVGLSASAVDRRQKRIEWRRLYGSRHLAPTRMFRRNAEVAANRILKLLESEDEKIKLRAAEMTLEFAGDEPTDDGSGVAAAARRLPDDVAAGVRALLVGLAGHRRHRAARRTEAE